MAEQHFIYVEPGAEEVDVDNVIDKIAFAAHNCYHLKIKSHEENARFVAQLIGNRHLAMVEHGVFTIVTDPALLTALQRFANPFIRYDLNGDKLYVSFSLRPLIENAANPDASARLVVATLALAVPAECRALIPHKVDFVSPYQSQLLTKDEVMALPEPSRKRHLFISMLVKTDRGVTHELVRHRLCAFAQESTRYCNYAKDRFSNTVAILKPLDYAERDKFYDAIFENAAASYFALLEAKALPQQARAVLPTALKAEIVISAYLDEWQHIFALRLAKDSHPEARRTVGLVFDAMVEKAYLKPQERPN